MLSEIINNYLKDMKHMMNGEARERYLPMIGNIFDSGNSFFALSDMLKRLVCAYNNSKCENVFSCEDGEFNVTYIQNRVDDYTLLAFSEKYLFIADSSQSNLNYFEIERKDNTLSEVIGLLEEHIPVIFSESFRVISKSETIPNFKTSLVVDDCNRFIGQVVRLLSELEVDTEELEAN